MYLPYLPRLQRHLKANKNEKKYIDLHLEIPDFLLIFDFSASPYFLPPFAMCTGVQQKSGEYVLYFLWLLLQIGGVSCLAHSEF